MSDNTVEGNLGLVRACCKRFTGRGIEYEELYSAGCLGLVKAVKNFNPDLGLKLSTYAVPVVLGEIKRLFRDGGAVKVSRSIKELSLRLKAAAQSFQNEHNREPTVGELAELLSESEEKISEALCASRPPLSLSGDDEDGNVIELPSADTTELLCEKIALRQALRSLSEGDKKIIELRYYRHNTQSKTAAALGMTQVQVSRREKKILTAIRQKLI